MAIGKSKLSDMDFGSFKDTIDKNIETDKASDPPPQTSPALHGGVEGIRLPQTYPLPCADHGRAHRFHAAIPGDAQILRAYAI